MMTTREEHNKTSTRSALEVPRLATRQPECRSAQPQALRVLRPLADNCAARCCGAAFGDRSAQDGVQVPAARHALEFVFASVFEVDS
jgi:hypothetical protein